jgi:hypothetical protein
MIKILSRKTFSILLLEPDSSMPPEAPTRRLFAGRNNGYPSESEDRVAATAANLLCCRRA